MRRVTTDGTRTSATLPSPHPWACYHEAADTALDAVLAGDALRTVFQPLVWLDSGALAGVEALTRGPADHPLTMPEDLFAAARRAGRVLELDRACARRALTACRDRGIDGGAPVFVNLEAVSLTPRLVRKVAAMRDGLAPRARVVIEITERAIGDDPAGILAAVREARRHGLGVALDDVGAEPASLALLPLVRPDVVKLDRSVVRTTDRVQAAAMASAVGAYAESSGAVVVAEGIETDADRAWAVAIGAHVGQGWLFGRPRELVELDRPVTAVALLREPHADPAQTPFSLVAMQGDIRVARKAELLAMSRHLERVAGQWNADASCVTACFQNVGHLDAATAEVYADLARRSPLVAVFGAGLPSCPAPGVRGVPLSLDDPLRDEWNVVVLGPHHASALLSRDLGDAGADRDRRFEFLVTHRRDLVVQATRALVARMTGG